MSDESTRPTQHEHGDERLRVECREGMTGETRLRVVKETWEADGYGGGCWEYANAMPVEDESAFRTLHESLNEWFNDE